MKTRTPKHPAQTEVVAHEATKADMERGSRPGVRGANQRPASPPAEAVRGDMYSDRLGETATFSPRRDVWRGDMYSDRIQQAERPEAEPKPEVFRETGSRDDGSAEDGGSKQSAK